MNLTLNLTVDNMPLTNGV